jgi:hypothetical protein
MNEEVTPEAEVQEAPVVDQSILDKILHRAAPTDSDYEADNCYNCHLNGKTVALNNGTCPDCGYIK